MTIPSTQTAWIYKEYGSKELLSTAEIPVPKPESDEVLVKVHAAALNPIDYKRLEGVLKAIGSDNLPTVPGYDVAGVVVAVGSKVTKFKVGDKVYGDLSEIALRPKQYGSLAQYTTVEEKLLAVIPQRLSFLEAASLPVAIETAYQGFEAANLKEGQTVLVLGGSGGVGTVAVQLAKFAFKASLVAATTSTTKVDFVKSLGADVVIDYRKENLEDHPTKYDVVYDTVGNNEGVKVVKKDGKVILIAGGGPVQPPAFNFGVKSKGETLEILNPLLEDGTLKPIIDKKGLFKFNELVQAFGYLEGGRATGKVVISVVD